jgi:tRNA dimethylallyltransferase
LQTVGYTELFDYLDGSISLQQAVELIKTNTRHYAKRQMTWFRKDASFQWFAPDAVEKIIGTVSGESANVKRQT